MSGREQPTLMAEAVAVDQLAVGTHACLTFTDQDERLDLLAAFVDEGLHAGARVVCFTDAISAGTLTSELSQRSVACDDATARDQLRVADCATWLRPGVPTAQRMLDSIAAVSYTQRQELLRFERRLSSLAPAGTLTTICQYDRDIFDPVTLAFAADVHQNAVAAQVYHEDPLLRVCRQYRPAGVRIAGELDFRNLAVLQQALAESIRLDHHVHLNLRQLQYMDAACAGEIVRAAVQLPADRHLVVRCGPLVDKLLRLCGGIDVAQLRVTSEP